MGWKVEIMPDARADLDRPGMSAGRRILGFLLLFILGTGEKYTRKFDQIIYP